jgi:hypothetical protein
MNTHHFPAKNLQAKIEYRVKRNLAKVADSVTIIEAVLVIAAQVKVVF